MSTTNTSLQDPASDDQIGHIKGLIDKQLRCLTNRQAQAIIGNGDIYQNHHQKMMEGVLIITTNTITRRVKINRTRTLQQILDATGRTQYVDNSVVKSIPQNEGEELEVEFFKRNQFTSDQELDRELEKRGLKRDIYALAVVNEADPAFADSYPNGMNWKNKDGNWCYIAFRRGGGERSVFVGRSGHGWDDRWWFGGVRKSRTLGN